MCFNEKSARKVYMFRVESSAITFIGLVRKSNEDNYYVNGKHKSNFGVEVEGYSEDTERGAYLYAVCDGMGGENFGELASMIAVMVLKKYQDTDLRKTLKTYIDTANNLICKEMKKNNGARIGTTLALLYLYENKVFSCNIGDSRTYLLRDDDLYLLSEDHTEAQRLVNIGAIRQEDAGAHKFRNKLTQHLGIFPEEMLIVPYISEEIELYQGDILMICSDGLTDMVNDDDIADCLAMPYISTTEMVKMLASKTQASGGRDNATIIAIKVI